MSPEGGEDTDGDEGLANGTGRCSTQIPGLSPLCPPLSQVSDNKASLPPKPGTMAAGSGGPASLSAAASSPLSSSLGTVGHRANSPSLFGAEGKPKMEPAASSQAALEELRTQVRELRSLIETMKDQQK